MLHSLHHMQYLILLEGTVKLLAASLIPFLLVFKHQQQVAQAVERAKQVTMAELNASSGESAMASGLPPTVCTASFPLF